MRHIGVSHDQDLHISLHALASLPPSVIKIDPFFDNDVAVVVSDDVVAVQAIAVLVESVGAFDAAVAFHGQQRVADLLRVGAASGRDRLGEDMDRVIGPRSEKVRRGLVGRQVFFGKCLGFRVCVGVEVGDRRY